VTRKEQYLAFLPFFEAEYKRYSALTQRATTFLGLTSIIVLFGGVNIGKHCDYFWSWLFSVATAASVVLAVLGSLASLWMRSYRDICDVEELVVTIDKNSYQEEDIYSILLAEMANATRHNRAVNTSRAHWLDFSATCFALAIVFVAATSVTSAYEPRKQIHTNESAQPNP